MEGFIASWYARTTKGDSRHAAWGETLSRELPKGARVLEIAPGPGYLSIELARRADLRVSGVDISESFVRIASDNARSAGVTVDFRHGNASKLPYESESFDFVVCQAAFKNFSDPVGALDEVHRVLAPGGRASIYDLRKEAPAEAIDAEIDRMKISGITKMWVRLTFRTFLLKNAYTEDALVRLVEQSRFGRGEIIRDGVGFDLRLAKS
jgi:ubiquinone/menaquinone biosynthesis C-methylase UbiE